MDTKNASLEGIGQKMKTIRWIHFSDLHLNIQNVETRLLRRGLMEYLRKHEICCDYAFCSGDLRNAPDKSFPENTVDLIKDICESVGVSLDNLFIVPGNHDINRDVEDREKTIGKILGGNKYGKGYYKPEEGIIEEEDLTVIKSGQTEFLALMEALYKDTPERVDKYRGVSHFVIETEDLNIVHLDSTITYGKSFEADLIIGTNQLYSVLDSINPQKHTVLLTHYPFDRLMPEERTELLEVMRQHDVKLWLSGHLHDVLVQKRQDYFYEFQCGNYVSDGGKSTVLLGELNLETGNGNVECLLWQKGDGWLLNQYLNKSSTEDKSKYPSINQPNIQESYPSLRMLINEIQQYYQKTLKVWDEMLKEHCSFLMGEDLGQYDEYSLNHIKYSDGLVYEVTYNKYGIFCIKFDGYLYTGGAHGIPYRKCIIFDLNTGKKKKLSEIVNYTYEELLPIVRESLFLRHSDGNHEMANMYLERIKKKYHAIDEFKYYLTEYGIIIYFDVYEISDFSRRYMELFIEFTDDLFLRQEIPENSIIIKSQKLRFNIL